MKNQEWEYFKKWLKAASIRAARSFVQAIVVGIYGLTEIAEVNWQMVLGGAALMAVASFCTSVANLPEIEDKNV